MKKRLLTIVTIAGIATPALAQTTGGDPRWSAWIGCWDPAGPASTARVCVSRTGDNGVLLRTTVSGQPAVEHTLIADGAEHPVSDAECHGTERAEWARNGPRLFTHSQLTCAGTARTASGISAIAPDGTWLDIEAVTIDGRESTRVRRYRPTAVSPTLRRAAPLTLDDVKEATTNARGAAVEALLAESRAQFDLSSRKLTDLAAAGVSPKLIDLMVALSYPNHFIVERSSGGAPLVFSVEDDPYLLGWAFRCPGFSFCADAYYAGLYPAYVYSPFAFGFTDYYYSYDLGPIGGGGGSPAPRSGTGVAINGLGYTRVRPRDEGPAQANVGTAGTGTRRTATASPQGYSAGSSSSSSGGSSSSSGSSSGGSSGGGDTGRTAVPR